MSDKFAFVAAEKADPASPFPVTLMCRWLEISTSGFYEWLEALPSARARRRATVGSHVQAAFKAGRGTYGVRRVRLVEEDDAEPVRLDLGQVPQGAEQAHRRRGDCPVGQLTGVEAGELEAHRVAVEVEPVVQDRAFAAGHRAVLTGVLVLGDDGLARRVGHRPNCRTALRGVAPARSVRSVRRHPWWGGCLVSWRTSARP